MGRPRAPLSGLVVLLLLALAPAAPAEDVIRLKGGGEIRGRIVEETDEEVTVDLAIGGSMAVPRSQILSIARGAEPEPGKPATERSEGSFLVVGPKGLEGWRRTTSYRRGAERLHESETVFLGESEEDPAVRIHIVEVAGEDHTARAFTYREKVGLQKEFLRRGEVDGRELRITEIRDGATRRRSVPFPEGTLFPAAARAMARARRAELEGELVTPVFDPITGAFATLRWTNGGRETVEHEGRQIEVLVLRAKREGTVSAERLTTDGRVVSSELNGPSLTAVAVPPERIEKLREGVRPDAPPEDRRHVHRDLRAGFAIRKPDATWTFQDGKGIRLVALKSLDLFAYVDVLRDTSVPRGTKLETLALNLQQRLAAESEAFAKESDGFTTMGGERAYVLTASSRLKGEKIRSRIVACLHDDVAWIVIAACPVDYFEKAKPVFEKIVASFEFL